jgi:hypothetical protein
MIYQIAIKALSITLGYALKAVKFSKDLISLPNIINMTGVYRN